MSAETREEGRMSNISVDSETKSIRERCIRVATIDIVTNEGTWNICIVEER